MSVRGKALEWAKKYFRLDSSDRLSGHPPLHFDLSFLDIFGTLAAGAQLHLVPHELSLLPHKIAEFTAPDVPFVSVLEIFVERYTGRPNKTYWSPERSGFE